MPTISPQVRISCQGAVIKFDSPVPATSTIMQPMIVRLRPTTSISPVRNGPVAPIRMMLSDTAPESPLQRDEHHPRGGAHADARENCREHHRQDDPCVVHPSAT